MIGESMPEEVTIYTKPGCPYCKAAKEELSRQGTSFTELDVTTDSAAKETAVKLAGKPVVPVIVEDGEVTVGFGGT
jgi:glutaredoxin 3